MAEINLREWVSLILVDNNAGEKQLSDREEKHWEKLWQI
jgi:hypothetical protein